MKKVILTTSQRIAHLFVFFQAKLIHKHSEIVISIEPQAICYSDDQDNKILAFSWFKNGFNLEDSNTSYTFDSAFPGSGNVDINNEMIDIQLLSGANIENHGYVYSNQVN